MLRPGSPANSLAQGRTAESPRRDTPLAAAGQPARQAAGASGMQLWALQDPGARPGPQPDPPVSLTPFKSSQATGIHYSAGPHMLGAQHGGAGDAFRGPRGGDHALEPPPLPDGFHKHPAAQRQGSQGGGELVLMYQPQGPDAGAAQWLAVGEPQRRGHAYAHPRQREGPASPPAQASMTAVSSHPAATQFRELDAAAAVSMQLCTASMSPAIHASQQQLPQQHFHHHHHHHHQEESVQQQQQKLKQQKFSHA